MKFEPCTTPLDKSPVVCVVGGGNAAHAMIALFGSRGITATWWAPFQDEAERLRKNMEGTSGITGDFAKECHPSGNVVGAPSVVSKDPKDVVPQADVIILPLPSFAYAQVLEDLKPHLRKGQYVGVTPGQGGFDWTARIVLGDKFNDIVIFSIQPMPFNCRITEFGKGVHVQTLKKNYKIGVIPNTDPDVIQRALKINVTLFGGSADYCGHFINCSLYPMNAIIHPQRIYRLLAISGWQPGQVLKENPLFYEEMDVESTDLMEQVNKELIAAAKALDAKRPDMHVEVPMILDFLSFAYDFPADNLKTFFSENPAYAGFRSPYKAVEGGFVPDFTNRYFTEDIPLGLCLYKGVADLVDVETPMMDKVITYMQGHMGKEYVKDGKLIGKDVGETTAPQRFGLTVESL
eukprot:Nk52_evm17s147 gene=Nk52_evmTU17s147